MVKHLSRYFALYILGLVVIILGVHFSVNQQAGQKFNLENLYKEAFCENCSADLEDYGQAPEFAGISTWHNSEQLTIEQLKGKVVLVDFWTYSCINCIRTLPHVTEWYEKYKDQGLVIVGVHTPEFEFEKDPANVQRAIERYKITYPVAQDNDYATWSAYKNQYWPAHYLVDQTGKIVYTHFGEGDYDITENTIRKLLNMETVAIPDTKEDSQAATPEIYFGTDRLEYLVSDQKPSAQPREYEFPKSIGFNRFALSGQWQFTPASALLNSGNGGIRLHYKAKQVHIVAAAEKPVTATITANGTTRTVEIGVSDLYTLFENEVAADGTLDIMFDGPVEVFTFTFG